MSQHRLLTVVPALLFGCLLAATSAADEKSQAKLDEAVELQLEAKTPADLKKVVQLCEEALKGDLDEANRGFAKELIASTLLDFCKQVATVLIQRPAINNPQWQQLHKETLADLQRAIDYGAKSGDAYLLLAKLFSLPGGDNEKAAESVSRAVDVSADDKKLHAEALILRAGLSKDPQSRLKDLNAALEAAPDNVQALQVRGLHYLSEKQFEEAIDDLTKVLEQNGDNLSALQTLIQAFVELGKFDEAQAQITKLIEGNPRSAIGYRMRAGLHAQQDDLDAAVTDLTKALEIQPNDLGSRLARAQIYQQQKKYAKARRDIDLALDQRPGLIAAIELRAQIAAAEGRYQAAINDMQDLLRHAPENVQWRLQLGLLFAEDKRPSRAVEQYSKVLQTQRDNWKVMRLRGDTLLNMGEHKKAIADFEAALELAPDDDGLLNNLAWVLATSPDDDLRNGKKAVELGKRACEVTEFKEPHILSTYAAGYAETGDFENAKKWSQKAVEVGQQEIDAEEDPEVKEALLKQLEQLKNELESYRHERPWREKQEVEENPDPILSSETTIDT